MCQSKHKNQRKILKDEDIITINIDTLEIFEELHFSSVFKNIRLIPLETNEKCLIGAISQIEIFDNKIYVLDSSVAKSLFVFDIEGRFIKKVGIVGKGSGEYIRPGMFSIDCLEKKIYILDSIQKKIIIFSIQGELEDELKLDASLLINQFTVSSNYIYIDQISAKHIKSKYLLNILNNSGKIIAENFSSKIYQKGFEQPYNISNNFFKSDKGIKYVKPLFDTVFSISEKIVQPYLVVSTENNVSSSEVQQLNKYDISELSEHYKTDFEGFMGITNYMESKNMITFNFWNKRKNHCLFYWPLLNKALCTTRLVDDLVKLEFPEKFYTVSDNYFISCVQSIIPGRMEIFINNLKNNLINLTINERIKLENLTPNSNPVIIFYENKIDFETTN